MAVVTPLLVTVKELFKKKKKNIEHSSGGRKSTPIILGLLSREQPSRLHLLLVSMLKHRFVSLLQ